MNFDDVFFPYLLKLFGEYQEDMEFSVEEAQAKGPYFFVEWVGTNLSDTLDEYDDDDDDEERTPEGDALFILSSFMRSEPDGHWIKDFWSSILLVQRGLPRHPVTEMHVNYILRWEDDRVFSFTCMLPSHLLSPKGRLSDYLVTKIGGLSSCQFHDMVAERSLDLLHDVQQFKITKEHIEEIFRYATDAVKTEVNPQRREDLQNAILFLRSIVLPPLPFEADVKARASVTGHDLRRGKWQILPIDPPQDNN
jgi:hypothetical protein